MFYNFERQIFNANSWSGNQNTTAANFSCFNRFKPMPAVPKLRYNDEGGSAGGPVYIPHVYNGKNRTFWFFTWEGYWQPAAVAQNLSECVATAAEIQGNFQGVYGATQPGDLRPRHHHGEVSARPLVRPAPTTSFPPPASAPSPRISSRYIPAPNSGSGGSPVGDYYFNQTTTVTDKDWSIKIDHSLGTKSHFSFFETHRFEPSACGSISSRSLSDGLVSTTDPHQFRASWDWVATPHVVLHSYWSGDFDNQQWNNPLQNGYGCKLGFTADLPAGPTQTPHHK